MTQQQNSPQPVQLVRLELTGFGRFRDRTIDLSPGLNLIEGGNEAGKSTLQAFVCGMLYGFFQPGAKRRSYTPQLERFCPWDGGSYRGSLICQKADRTYRIERDFGRENERVRVFDEQTGEDLTDTFAYDPVTRQPQVGQALLGLSKTAFESTASIAQLGCAGVSRQEFASEVSERLISMSQTADTGLSLNGALQELESRANSIGSPKKSKTPYGKISQKLHELQEELVESQKGEGEYLSIQKQEKQLLEQVDALRSQQKQLEGQLRQNSAQELEARYLKAQNLQARIERLQKEQDRCAPFAQLQLEQLDQAMRRIGARAQISRTLEKYRRAVSEVEKRAGELETLYRTLEVSAASGQDLEQFDRMLERQSAIGELQRQIQELRSQLEKLDNYCKTLPDTDPQKLEDDLHLYRKLQEKRAQSAPNARRFFLLALLLLLIGAALLCWGAINRLALCAVPGILCLSAGAGLLIYGLRTASSFPKNAGEMQQEILQQYPLDLQQDPIAQLETLLRRAQVSDGRREQVREQQQLLRREMEQKLEMERQRQQEMAQYLGRLTGREERVDEVRLKALRESVNQAKRIRSDLHRLRLQHQQLGQEAQNCESQIAEIDRSIQPVIAQAKSASAAEEGSASDLLARCRQNKLRFDSVRSELTLQQQLLQETLGGYTFEQLAQQAKDKSVPPSEEGASIDAQQLRDQLQAVTAQLEESASRAAQLTGLRQGREETLRPCGQIQAQIDELRELCAQYQFELDAISLAKERLCALSGQLHRDFAPRLNTKVSQAVGLMTGGKYTRVVIDQNLGVHLEDKEQGRMVALSELSSGAMDLIYLIVRLELLDLLCGQGVPVLLDDSFAQLDDLRAARLLRYLAQKAQSGAQLLLLSCHSREKAILQKAGIPHHIVTL